MNSPSSNLQTVLDRSFADLRQRREAFSAQLAPRETGTITQVSTGIAMVSGLPGVGYDELIAFPGGVFGIAFNVDELEVGVVLLGEYWHLRAGDEVRGQDVLLVRGRVAAPGVDTGERVGALHQEAEDEYCEAEEIMLGQAVDVREAHPLQLGRGELRLPDWGAVDGAAVQVGDLE